MSLTSMKISAPEKKRKEISVVESFPAYSHGLRIVFEDADIKRLGLDVSDLKVGASVRLAAKAKIIQVSVRAVDGFDKGCSLELQITHLDLVDQDSARAAFKEAFG